MNKEFLTLIHDILYQVKGPVKITYQTKQINLISEELVDFHIKKIKNLIDLNGNLDAYEISDIYSLYRCLEYIINDLGIEEFHTVLGKDFYRDGLHLLYQLKTLI